MTRVTDLMKRAWAGRKKFNFPLKLISSEMPIGINYKAGVSAQLKSAVILAGLNSFGNTEITETEKSRDHSENILCSNLKAIKIKLFCDII